MCFTAEQPERGVISGYDNDLLAVEVAGGNVELLTETLAILKKLRIVSVDDGTIVFINFIKRQYDKPSDHPEKVKERVSRHREKKRNANETPGNDQYTETDPDSDSESLFPSPLPPSSESQETAQEEHGADFEEAWKVYPRKKEKRAAEKQWKARVKEGHLPRDMLKATWAYAAECKRLRTLEQYIKLPKTFFGPSKPFLDYLGKEDESNGDDFKPYRG